MSGHIKTTGLQSTRSGLNQFFMIALLIATQTAEAATRIVTRSDYGEKGLAIATDRINGLSRTLTGQPLSGGYDLVYQENIESKMAEIYQCPTASRCHGDTKCMMSPQYWNCQALYKADHHELCRYYKAGTKALNFTSWAFGEILGGVIINQIAFLNYGIGLAAVDISEVVDDYHFVKDLIGASCASEGLDVALQNVNSNGLLFAEERKKEQVLNALTIFRASNTIQEEGSFPVSLQKAGQLGPLRSVVMDPTSIKNGVMEVFERP